MARQLHLADPEICVGCGICADACPGSVLEVLEGKATTIEGRADACIMCGQCVAVCPSNALRMPDLPGHRFQDLSGLPFDYGEFLDFLRLRRSVRAFKDRPVEADLTGKILEAAATAPIGMPPHSTEVLIIEEREELDFLLKELVKDYAFMVRSFSNPLGRAMIRLAAGAESYRALRDHIVDKASKANGAYQRSGADEYMYNAPMLMLFHSNRSAMSYVENAHLVCHHAMLAAVSLGLGATIIGVIPPVVDRSKTLRSRYGIPKDNKVISALILGYPKYKFRKSIRRDLAGVRTVSPNRP
jgi:ferredoxin